MADGPNKPESTNSYLARRLTEATGITDVQARELIDLLGYEWPSLLREARILMRQKP